MVLFLAALDTHSVTYAIAGLAALAAAFLPRLIRDAPISVPIVCLAIGLLVFGLPFNVDPPDPIEFPKWAEYLTELGVIVSLMGAGLKLDRRVGWRAWASTWRLLAITMPLTIIATALLGWWMLGLAPAAAILLGAVLAPTDPVLASDVQVGPPGEAPEEEDPDDAEEEVRFSLTSEAGLNDALAFPFTNLAIVLAAKGLAPSEWLVEWLAIDVLYKLVIGFVAGLLIGKGLARLIFSRGELQLAKTGEGFVALAATFVSYGLTEVIGGYGFLAVFVAAVTLRHSESGHEYHETLHSFAEQTERMLMIGLVLLLGGAVAGGILNHLTLPAVALVALMLLVIRPLTGWLGLMTCPIRASDKGAIAFFGIRGIGSLYYLAHALNEAQFSQGPVLWSVVALAVVASVVVHGMAVTPVIKRLDASREEQMAA